MPLYVARAVWCVLVILSSLNAVTNPRAKLYDWNDVRLLIACAEHGGFAGAAEALAMDQKTISRRIGQLEAAVGRPLFSRRKSGSTLTSAGQVLLERAAVMNTAARELEMAMRGLSDLAAPTVTLSAPEGILSYLLVPLLLGDGTASLPLDRRLMKQAPPNLVFVTPPESADITIQPVNVDEAPAGRAAMKVRRLGRLTLVPLSSTQFLAGNPHPERFDDIAGLPVVDVSLYRQWRSLEAWTALVRDKANGGLVVAPNSSAMHRAVAAGAGLTISPAYAPLLDPRLTVVAVPHPAMALDLWLMAHEDVLRDRVVRQLYDDIATVFLQSPWFR